MKIRQPRRSLTPVELPFVTCEKHVFKQNEKDATEGCENICNVVKFTYPNPELAVCKAVMSVAQRLKDKMITVNCS